MRTCPPAAWPGGAAADRHRRKGHRIQTRKKACRRANPAYKPEGDLCRLLLPRKDWIVWKRLTLLRWSSSRNQRGLNRLFSLTWWPSSLATGCADLTSISLISRGGQWSISISSPAGRPREAHAASRKPAAQTHISKTVPPAALCVRRKSAGVKKSVKLQEQAELKNWKE